MLIRLKNANIHPMAVTFKIEHFEGPLDLLLRLVEQEELDISTVSLAKVAEQFAGYVQKSKDIPLEELADFLVVAAKLMYIKSKLLMPSLSDQEMEEGADLESQLREYQRFVAASRVINKMWNEKRESFPRQSAMTIKSEGFVPPGGVTTELLQQVMKRIIARLEPLIRLPQTSIERVVTIQDKIKSLFERVRKHAATTFHSFVSGVKDKTEAIVSFLALLELVKQRFVIADQKDLFHDIKIECDPDAPQSDPLAESFV